MSNPYPHDVRIYLPNFKPNFVNRVRGEVRNIDLREIKLMRKLFISVQTRPNSSRLVQTCPNLSKLVQTGLIFRKFQGVPNFQVLLDFYLTISKNFPISVGLRSGRTRPRHKCQGGGGLSPPCVQ